MSSPSKYHRTEVSEWIAWYYDEVGGCSEDVLLDEVLLAFGEPYPDTVDWLHAAVKKVVS